MPADFATETWALLYQSYDQNGNMLEPAKDNVSSAKEGAKLTFISDQPTLCATTRPKFLLSLLASHEVMLQFTVALSLILSPYWFLTS